jgi:hypothetical protein
MSAQFEFHLRGADAPEGQLDADHLLAIVTSLKEVATKIGRAETDAEPVGRAPKRVHRVAKLLIGLAPGSTTVLARRVGGGDGALDFDLPDEQAFDESFQDLIESIALDQRPGWVSDSLSLAAADLAGALQQAAPEIEFKVSGQSRRTFRATDVHRETWRVAATSRRNTVTFVGRLYAVNLKTHRLQVQDDVGTQVALPGVLHDADAGRLLGAHVTVTGTPELDTRGRLTHIHDATIEAAPDPLAGDVVPGVVSLEEILASAPGIEPGGIGLTEAESDAFFEAMGL